jgi:hypothetical protein
VIDQCLVIGLGLSVNGAYIVEDIGFVRDVADTAVYGQCPATGGKPFYVRSPAAVDASDAVVKDRLVLRPADLTEYLQ